MNVLVDTSVWLLALRREVPKSRAATEALSELIRELRVMIIGPIRQELLSGIRSEKQFEELRLHLSAKDFIAFRKHLLIKLYSSENMPHPEK